MAFSLIRFCISVDEEVSLSLVLTTDFKPEDSIYTLLDSVFSFPLDGDLFLRIVEDYFIVFVAPYWKL